MTLTIQTADVDKDGFLKNLSCWNEAVAYGIAQTDNIELTASHFEIIYLLRTFYQDHQVAPANRPFVKMVQLALGKDKGNSIYLMTLFPQSPAKLAAKISGLPKPPNCF
jgi:tRNA 2-thiouridine synthesizing protein E